jgi:hypothetical protein
MKTITKKIDKEWLDMILAGKKKFELRLADFDIEDGDILRLEEWAGIGANRKPTGRFVEKQITYARKVDLKKWIENQPDLIDKGFFVLQFE